jgi:hypothetical protein
VPPPPQQPVPAQQAVPHVCGFAAPQAQAPAEQLRPAPQALPHAPQFASLVCVSTQIPEQFVLPTAQHLPEEQLGVAPEQAVAQPPQWAGSLARFTQPVVAPQSSGYALDPQPQVPPEQVARGGHGLPHPPQFAGSTRVFTQNPVPPFPQAVAAGVPAQTHAPVTHGASLAATPAAAQTKPHWPQ